MDFILEKLSKLINNTIKPWYKLYGNNIPHTLNYSEGSMYDAFLDAEKKYPFYKAYNYFGKKVRYKNLNKQIIECAKSLKAIGIKKGDRVTICMPNMPDAIIMFYAVNAVGAVSNIIHPLSSENEIQFFLRKSSSKCILCLDSIYPKVNAIIENTKVKKVIISRVTNKMPLLLKIAYPFKNKIPKIKFNENVISFNKFIKLGKKYKDNYIEKVKKHDDAVILYSGGTTGDAKGVVLSNLNFNALATQCFKMADPTKPGDKMLTIMPIFHGFGIGVSVHTELTNGMEIILVPRFNAKDFSKLIKKYKPEFLAGVPTMYEALISSNEKSKTYLKNLVNVICGGDILTEALRNKVDTYLKEHGAKTNIRVGYGLTECTAASCLTPRFYFKEGGIGIPLPDMLYKIVKTGTEKEVSINTDGEICISGPTVMKRYLDDDTETKKALKRHSDGKIWLHTGDLGYMNEEGLVFFKSRLKRMIISSGYNIYPQYIEKVLLTHPAIDNCAVIGIPHDYKKEVPKAFIVLRKNFDNTEDLRNDIKKYASKSIAKYALPAEYEYVEELPKTKLGKIDYKKL